MTIKRAENKLVDKVRRAATMVTDPRLTHAERCVGLALLLYFHNTKTGKCFPSYPQLAEAANVSERTAMRAAARLKELGHIDFADNTGGRNIRNEYTFESVTPVTSFDDEKGDTSDTLSDILNDETLTPATRKGDNSDKKPCHQCHPHLPNESPGESPGEEKRERRKRRTPISPDAKMTPRQIEIAESMGFTTMESRRDVWLKFRDWHLAKGSVFADWDAAWRNWCRAEVKFTKKDNSSFQGRQIGDVVIENGKRFEYAGNGVAGGWLEIDD